MPERSKPKFAVMTYHRPEREWSVGLGVTHDWNETYVWFNLAKWHISIGYFCRED